MKVIEIKENEFNDKVKNNKGKVIVDCYASWCGPCRMLSPILDEVAEEVDTCKFYKIDIDDASSVAQEYRVMSIPNLLVFEDGKLKGQTVGLKTKEEIKELIEK